MHGLPPQHHLAPRQHLRRGLHVRARLQRRARRVRSVRGWLFQGERRQRELCGLQLKRNVARGVDPPAQLLVRARLLRARRRAVC